MSWAEDEISHMQRALEIAENGRGQVRPNPLVGCVLVKNGKITDMVKNPTYTGITPNFWGSMDMLAGEDEWVFWGTPNCGKGQPGQVGHTGHPLSPARFKNVRIGVKG